VRGVVPLRSTPQVQDAETKTAMSEAPLVPRTPDRGETSLCSDCPVVGEKLDPTRCVKCPFRRFEMHTERLLKTGHF
jgi:hypothetical protein